MEHTLRTAGLLVIKDNKLLLAYSKNKQCFYLPGGKIEEDETAAAALCREIAEELHVRLSASDLEYYTHISAPAYGENKGIVMEQDCFLVHCDIEPVPGAEIGELRYFSLREYLEQAATAPGAVMILEQLAAAGLVDY